MEDSILQPILRVDPGEDGEGLKQTLMWNGDDAGLVTAVFQGQDISTEVDNKALLRDADELLALAMKGKLQIVQVNQPLMSELRNKVWALDD